MAWAEEQDVVAATLSHPADILIVDDFEPNLVALEAVLAPLGHRLVRAASGEGALKRLLEQDFALILLDVMMPTLDGYQTAAMIRDRERSRHTPIIFVSAINRSHNDLMHGYAQGAVDYILKPYDPDILRAKVDVFVQFYRTREENKRQESLLRARDRERDVMRLEVREARVARGEAEAYRFLAESIPQQVWAADADGGLDYVNPVVVHYFGQPASTILGNGWLAVLHPDDVALATTTWQHSLTTGEPYEIEFRLRRSDGEYRWHLGRAVPERGLDGRIVRWFGTNTDIHDRRRIESQLRAATRSRDDLLATVSHDLRDPLGAISLATALLRRSATTPDLDRAVGSIERATARMEALLRDLLDISSIESGHLSITPEPCAASYLIEEAVALIASRAVAKGLALETRLPAHDATVLCDKGRILQVFSNLLGNAVKFTPAGGTLSIATVPERHCVTFVVGDTGPGIAPTELAHVFERFWKSGDQGTAGTGLGLAICQGIIEQHGGTIRVDSELGRGTSFSFTIPIASRP
ncbi:MAG: response regulator [Deltaproteobacteria bacterium]|nr:response regulator [Deltaproteobacteria bacterium]